MIAPQGALRKTREHQHDRAAAHGADRSRSAGRWRRRGGVAVTTFGSLGTSPPTSTRTRPKLALFVVDEAHHVKNPDAKRSCAVNRVAASSERVLFFIYTPMESRRTSF
jgi:superfamily II DNA or RNA helicase